VKKSIPGAMALASLLAVPAVALAAAASGPAPKFAAATIVPNVSLGGLTLNAPTATARRVFAAKECSRGSCSYTAADAASVSVLAYQKTKHSKTLIGRIFISVPPGQSDPVPALKTAQGIGIGSSYAAVKKAYPNAKKVGQGALQIKGHGTFSTVFQATGGKVVSIGMESVQFG
jgi:hypothetical protein